MGGQMILGALIDALKPLKPDTAVSFDFAFLDPTDFDSYRGYYDQLALGFTGGRHSDGWAEIKVAELLAKAEAAVGKTYEGWKGGDYVMTRSTPLWVANPGCTGSTAIVGVQDIGWAILLITANVDAES